MEKVSCEICNEAYNFFTNRPHVCKRCKRSVCSKCGKNFASIIQSIEKVMKSERICRICEDESNFQKSTLSLNECSWNRNSKLTVIWLAFLKMGQADSLKSQYEQDQLGLDKTTKAYLDLIEIVKIEVDQVMRGNPIFQQLYSEEKYFNFSFVEWIYRVLEKGKPQNKQEIHQVVSDVISCFLLNKCSVGFSKQLFQLSFVLLTFCHQSVVYFLLHKIFNSILPEHFWPISQAKPDFVQAQETQTNKTVGEFQSLFKLNPSEVPLIKKTIQQLQLKFESGLLVNSINFRVFFSLLNELFDNPNYDKVHSYFLGTLHRNIRFIQKGYNKSALEYYITRETQIQSLKETLKKMEDKQENMNRQLRTPRNFKLTLVQPNSDQSPKYFESQQNNKFFSGRQPQTQRHSTQIVSQSFIGGQVPHRQSDVKRTTSNNNTMTKKYKLILSYLIQSRPLQLNLTGILMDNTMEEEEEVGEVEEFEGAREQLKEQQEEIQQLRQMIKSKDEEIKRMQQSNLELSRQVKGLQVNGIVYNKNVQNQFEIIDQQQLQLFEGLIERLENETLNFQKLQTEVIKLS